MLSHSFLKLLAIGLFVGLGGVDISFAGLTAPNSFYSSVSYSCYGGTAITIGGNGVCKSGNEWETYAIRACKNRSNRQGKIGVNSFSVGATCVQPRSIRQSIRPCGNTTCPLVGCVDVDKDGHCAPRDCDDNNKIVYPGQLSYFSTPRANGSYDYNCDGSQTVHPSFNGSSQVGKYIMNPSTKIAPGNGLFYEYRNGINTSEPGNTLLCTGKPHPRSVGKGGHVNYVFSHPGTLITSNSQLQCGLIINNTHSVWGKKYTMIGNTCTEVTIPYYIRSVSCR